jgi:Zn-dependent peptidase ImmA (M78 family)/DNA-binding XRE family transcriptional regulator
MIVHERLKYAREKAGLTQQAASEATEIGVSALSEFEAGKREPRLPQLQKLAALYHCSLVFFLDDAPLPVEMVLWREKPASPAAEQIGGKFLELCRQYRSLEAWCGERGAVERTFPAARESGAQFSYEDAEELACRVRDDLGLGERPGATLLRVLEEVCGVKVFHLPIEPSGCAACSVNDRFGWAILLNSRNVPWRRNYDLAHELFHLLTWNLFRTGDGNESATAPEREETLANVFASHLLMPTQAIRRAVNPLIRDERLTLKMLYDVARQFDVSIEAVLWRTKDVYGFEKQRIQQAVDQYRGLALEWEAREKDDPPRRPQRFVALAKRAFERGEIATGRLAEYLGVTRQEVMRWADKEVPTDVTLEVAHS